MYEKMRDNGRFWSIFLFDLITIYGLYYWFYRYYEHSPMISAKAVLLMGAVAFVWTFITVNSNVCSLSSKTRLYDLLLATLLGYSLLSVFIIAVVAVFSQFKPNANLILYPILLSFSASIFVRCFAFVIRRHFVLHGYMQKKVLIVGGDRISERVIKKIRFTPQLGYNIYGVIADYYHDTMPKGLYLGKLERIGEILESQLLDEVLIALPLRREKEIVSIVETCEREGVRFRIIPDFYRVIENRASLDYLDDIPLISIRTEPLHSMKSIVLKRCFDIMFSMCVMAFFSPVFLVLALMVKLSSPGPVFFKQKRIGANNIEFEMYKFRTMGVQETKQSDTVWTTEADPRVTKVGKFLRKSSLDEMPQFWNVFVGNMSVVGPRPERKFFVEKFKENVPRYKVRHQVKSGISGWAQVNGLRGDTSIKDRVEHDLYYIENWSLWFDLVIIWKTVFGRKTISNAY